MNSRSESQTEGLEDKNRTFTIGRTVKAGRCSSSDVRYIRFDSQTKALLRTRSVSSPLDALSKPADAAPDVLKRRSMSVESDRRPPTPVSRLLRKGASPSGSLTPVQSDTQTCHVIECDISIPAPVSRLIWKGASLSGSLTPGQSDSQTCR